MECRGGVGLVVRDQPKGWSVKSMRFHGPNVVICKIVARVKNTSLIGANLLPSTLDHLPDFEEALTRFWDHYPMVLGDLKSNISQAQNPCRQKFTDLLMEFGLVDLLHHFQQPWRFRNMSTWLQVQGGRFLRKICNYILETDCGQFEMVGIRDVHN